jgi:hypothetical protein
VKTFDDPQELRLELIVGVHRKWVRFKSFLPSRPLNKEVKHDEDPWICVGAFGGAAGNPSRVRRRSRDTSGLFDTSSLGVLLVASDHTFDCIGSRSHLRCVEGRVILRLREDEALGSVKTW